MMCLTQISRLTRLTQGYSHALGLLLLFVASFTYTGVTANLRQYPQCERPSGGSNWDSQVTFCLEAAGGLSPYYPTSLCSRSSEAVIIEGYEVRAPTPWFTPREGLTCNKAMVNGFDYGNAMNATCLQKHGAGSVVKKAILPFIGMYSGRREAKLPQVDVTEFRGQVGREPYVLPDFTWISLRTRCLHKTSTTKQLYADICSNMQQRGASRVHIEFLPLGGAYTNQSSCSCNIFSQSEEPSDADLTVRAVDVRLRDSPTSIFLRGSRSSRTLDNREVLYWALDKDLIKSHKQLFLEMRDLSQSALPEKVWLEVAGVNLTVNCGPRDKPGGHRPLSGDSGSLGIGYIVAIVVGLLLLIVIIVMVVKCVFGRRRRRESMKDDEDYDITMGSHDDIEDRQAVQALALHKKQSAAGEAEPGVTYSQPRRALASPVAASPDEAQVALLNETVDSRDDDNNSNNNTAEKEPSSPLPPPPPEASYHEVLLAKQMSYIDDEDEELPPPPPITPTEEIYNHLNDHRRPDVVPGNIYDTSAAGENHYSSTGKGRQPAGAAENLYDG